MVTTVLPGIAFIWTAKKVSLIWCPFQDNFTFWEHRNHQIICLYNYSVSNNYFYILLKYIFLQISFWYCCYMFYQASQVSCISSKLDTDNQVSVPTRKKLYFGRPALFRGKDKMFIISRPFTWNFIHVKLFLSLFSN